MSLAKCAAGADDQFAHLLGERCARARCGRRRGSGRYRGPERVGQRGQGMVFETRRAPGPDAAVSPAV